MKTDADHTRRRLALALLGATLVPGAVFGQTAAQRRRQLRRQQRQERRQNRRQGRQSLDSDAVRDAVRRGEIEPLRTLMQYFQQRTGAEIIDVQYRQLGGRHFYGFKVRTPRGRLRWAVIDAATREIMTPQEARRRYGQ